MFSINSLRLATRYVPFASVSRYQFNGVPSTPSRSFLTSAVRANLTTHKPRETDHKDVKAPKKKAEPKPKPEKDSKVKKSKVKPKPRRITVPTLPRYGPSPFIHFIKSYFNVGKPAITAETLISRAREAGVAWKELSEHEKEKIQAESRVLRDEARAKRDAFVCDLEPAVLKELNRRRAARNKHRILAHHPDNFKRPKNAYILFIIDYRKTHGHTLEGLPLTQQTEKMVGIWRNMSDAEKEPWVVRYKEAKAEWDHSRDGNKENSPTP